jgi:RNA polymerase sigma-70 factor (ECF subfamily)
MGLPEATNLSEQPLTYGQRDALEMLVRDYHAPVTRLAYRLLGWRGDVEDVVHDVFLAAFKQQHRFRGESSPWTWLAAITINRCRTHLRRKLLHLRWLRKREVRREDASDAQPIERDETARKVRDAVAKLSPRDREVIVLYYLEELTVPEISGITGARDKAIHVRLHRARKRLKGLLGNEG